jgi:hypothetical protein
VLLRWDGRRWSTMSSTLGEFRERIFAATATSPSDLWLVGEFVPTWDGRGWERVSLPVEGNARLAGLAVATGDLWAVGYRDHPAGPLVLHRDGRFFAVGARLDQPPPSAAGDGSALVGMGGCGR